VKRLLHILRLAALAPFVILMGAESDAEAAAKTKAEADAKAAAEKKAAEEEAAKKTMVTITQEDLDKLIQQRLARGGKAAVEEYLKGLGMTKEQVDALIKKSKEDEEKNKTELQKEKERGDRAEAEKSAALTTANAKLARAAFLVQAIAAGIPPDRAEDAAALVAAQLAELKPDEKTGDFKTDEVKTIAESLVKTKPWLKSDGKGGNVGGASNAQGELKSGDIGAKYAKQRAEENKVENDPWAPKL